MKNFSLEESDIIKSKTLIARITKMLASENLSDDSRKDFELILENLKIDLKNRENKLRKQKKLISD